MLAKHCERHLPDMREFGLLDTSYKVVIPGVVTARGRHGI